jgi:hypothetical protein
MFDVRGLMFEVMRLNVQDASGGLNIEQGTLNIQ